MKFFIYVGLNAKFLDLKEEAAEDRFHLTIMYAPMKATGRHYLGQAGTLGYGTDVEDVVYWKHVDLTVAVIRNTNNIQRRFDKYSKELGFEYEHEFIPHITLGSGDLTDKYAYLKGTDVDLSTEYMKIIEK